MARQVQTAWVVEHGPAQAPAYLRFGRAGPCWTLDPFKAVRFARPVDAELAAACFTGPGVRIAKHEWETPDGEMA